jgi:hypothetical protein
LEHCSYETPVYLEPDQTSVPLWFHWNHFIWLIHMLAVVYSSPTCCRPCSQESIACINDQAGISGQCKSLFLYHLIVNFSFNFATQLPTFPLIFVLKLTRYLRGAF